jgi:hypothetical protein
MRQDSSTVHTLLRFVVRSTFLWLILISCSACVRYPNTIPDGYGDIFTDDARSSTVARVDYPIVINLNPAEESIGFRVTKKGENFWFWNGEFWDKPFLKGVNWYRVSLLAAGEPDPICISDLTKAGDAEVITIPCKFTIKNYLSKPLIGMLDFWTTGNNDIPPAPNDAPLGVVDRVYYLIPNQ